MRLHFFTIILLSLFSCENKKPLDNENKTEYTFGPKGTISYVLPEGMRHVNSSIQSIDTDDQRIFSILNTLENKLVTYNTNGEISKSIHLQHEGPDGVGLLTQSSSHYFINKDSILIYNIQMANLFLVNENAEVLEKYQLVDLKNDRDVGVPYPYSLSPIEYYEGSVYFPLTFNNQPEKFSEFPSILKLDLLSKEKTYLQKLPEEYDDKNWGIYFKYLPSFTFNKSQEKLVVNYPISSDLIVGSINNSNKEKFEARSSFIEKVGYFSEEMLDRSKRPTPELYNQMTMTSFSESDYASILYDKHEDMYYRIAHLRPSIDQVKKGERFPSLSIIILNSDFEKVGEKQFDKNLYHHSMLYVDHNGLNIARKDKFLENEDYLTFEVFKPEISKTD